MNPVAEDESGWTQEALGMLPAVLHDHFWRQQTINGEHLCRHLTFTILEQDVVLHCQAAVLRVHYAVKLDGSIIGSGSGDSGRSESQLSYSASSHDARHIANQRRLKKQPHIPRKR